MYTHIEQLPLHSLVGSGSFARIPKSTLPYEPNDAHWVLRPFPELKLQHCISELNTPSVPRAIYLSFRSTGRVNESGGILNQILPLWNKGSEIQLPLGFVRQLQNTLLPFHGLLVDQQLEYVQKPFGAVQRAGGENVSAPLQPPFRVEMSRRQSRKL